MKNAITNTLLIALLFLPIGIGIGIAVRVPLAGGSEGVVKYEVSVRHVHELPPAPPPIQRRINPPPLEPFVFPEGMEPAPQPGLPPWGEGLDVRWH